MVAHVDLVAMAMPLGHGRRPVDPVGERADRILHVRDGQVAA